MNLNVPLLIAHRGWRRRYPENTLPALQAAAEAGACYVECDVQLTADRVPVLCHDMELARVSGRPGRLDHLTWDQLAGYRAAEPARLGPRFADTPFCRLDQFAAWLQGWPRLQAFVEIKEESIAAYGLEETVAAVADALAPCRERCIALSFAADALAAARRAGLPRCGWVLGAWKDLKRAAALAPDFLFCNHEKIPRRSEPLPRDGWQWALYEIDTPEDALAWAGAGAQFIETFAIGELLADTRLARRACRDD